MPSSNQSISAPGFAFVTATAILANPRSISGTKFIIFDVQLYIGPNPHNVLLGSLRYFNLSNMVFSQDPQLYHLYFMLARREPGTEVHASSPDRLPSDYDFVGDIEWLHPLGPPGPRYLVHPPDGATFEDLDPKEVTASDSLSMTGQDNPDDIYGSPCPSGPTQEWPSFTIDPCQQPIVHAVGVATNCNRSSTIPSFEIRVKQPYMSYYKDANNKQFTQFLCTFADLGKYKNSKPTPYDNRIVTFYSRLTGVKNQTSSDEECIDYFKVELHSIHFCGQYILPAANSASNSSSVFLDKGSSMRTGKTLYALNTPTTGNSALHSPKTPRTPTPSFAPRKRGVENSEPEGGPARKYPRYNSTSNSSTPASNATQVCNSDSVA